LNNLRSAGVFGVLDGHGGSKAAQYCSENLVAEIQAVQ